MAFSLLQIWFAFQAFMGMIIFTSVSEINQLYGQIVECFCTHYIAFCGILVPFLNNQVDINLILKQLVCIQ